VKCGTPCKKNVQRTGAFHQHHHYQQALLHRVVGGLVDEKMTAALLDRLTRVESSNNQSMAQLP
jgi:hypothetical protein